MTKQTHMPWEANEKPGTAPKHSPAPWDFRFDSGYIINNEGDLIGDVSVSENIDYFTAKANGVLQAAAPAMLSALKEVAVGLEDVARVPQSVYDAIKLAEGK